MKLFPLLGDLRSLSRPFRLLLWEEEASSLRWRAPETARLLSSTPVATGFLHQWSFRLAKSTRASPAPTAAATPFRFLSPRRSGPSATGRSRPLRGRMLCGMRRVDRCCRCTRI